MTMRYTSLLFTYLLTYLYHVKARGELSGVGNVRGEYVRSEYVQGGMSGSHCVGPTDNAEKTGQIEPASRN